MTSKTSCHTIDNNTFFLSFVTRKFVLNEKDGFKIKIKHRPSYCL